MCVRAGLYRSIILDDVLKLKCLHAELLAKRCKEQSEKVCGLHAVGLAVWSCIVGQYAMYKQISSSFYKYRRISNIVTLFLECTCSKEL